MAKIDCNVTNCSYNQASGCYATAIKVGGQAAQTVEDTSCGSFLNQEAYSKLADSTAMNNGGQIFCNVDTCTHHFGERCKLDQILVGGNSNSTVYTETDCMSFEAK